MSNVTIIASVEVETLFTSLQSSWLKIAEHAIRKACSWKRCGAGSCVCFVSGSLLSALDTQSIAACCQLVPGTACGSHALRQGWLAVQQVRVRFIRVNVRLLLQLFVLAMILYQVGCASLYSHRNSVPTHIRPPLSFLGLVKLPLLVILWFLSFYIPICASHTHVRRLAFE